jgi:hypothetical protein
MPSRLDSTPGFSAPPFLSFMLPCDSVRYHCVIGLKILFFSEGIINDFQRWQAGSLGNPKQGTDNLNLTLFETVW